MAQWFESMLGAQVLRSMQEGKPRIDLKLGGANIFIAPVANGDGTNAAPAIPPAAFKHGTVGHRADPPNCGKVKPNGGVLLVPCTKTGGVEEFA